MCYPLSSRVSECRRVLYGVVVVCVCVLALVAPSYAQEPEETQPEESLPDQAVEVRPLLPEDAEAGRLSGLLELGRELPRGFRNIQFGLSRDEVGELLMEDPNFNYRGDPDVQFLPRRERVVIDSQGFDFISRGYFQFRDDALYSIILNLNRNRMDYFTMYTQLSDRYGNPDTLSPQAAVWEDDTVRLALERPLSVKYLDLAVFEELREEGQMRESDRAAARREFLEQF